MRFLMSICFFCLSVGFSAVCVAQDTKADAESSKNAPTEETTKSESPPKDAEEVDEPFDIDGFFKQGEENAKKGSSF